ncbi:PIR Superfamily Protein [Plasmodium ovale curtisi]|uniref:PIR Superfamily Protein n=1 Tax=Plasmodium ovale curtisi TaxID=864141 RepID=A0A1A8WLB6_PLAOA|nr:PIR Superfamily Protein [Plasmodium ovale curtisi]
MSSQKLFSKSSKDLYSDQFYEALHSDSLDLSKYDNQYNVSTLFNYWLYSMLTHIYGANSTNKISASFSALQLKWTYFDYRRINEPYYLKCKPNFEIVNHNDWDKRKKLYDYYVDYDILIGHGTRSEKEVTSETSQIGTKVGQSVLGITPVLITTSALYRYTPIGSWIRKLGENPTNSISVIDEGEIEGFFTSSHESRGMLFGDAQNYISYQPM